MSTRPTSELPWLCIPQARTLDCRISAVLPLRVMAQHAVLTGMLHAVNKFRLKQNRIQVDSSSKSAHERRKVKAEGRLEGRLEGSRMQSVLQGIHAQELRSFQPTSGYLQTLRVRTSCLESLALLRCILH